MDEFWGGSPRGRGVGAGEDGEGHEGRDNGGGGGSKKGLYRRYTFLRAFFFLRSTMKAGIQYASKSGIHTNSLGITPSAIGPVTAATYCQSLSHHIAFSCGQKAYPRPIVSFSSFSVPSITVQSVPMLYPPKENKVLVSPLITASFAPRR